MRPNQVKHTCDVLGAGDWVYGLREDLSSYTLLTMQYTDAPPSASYPVMLYSHTVRQPLSQKPKESWSAEVTMSTGDDVKKWSITASINFRVSVAFKFKDADSVEITKNGTIIYPI